MGIYNMIANSLKRNDVLNIIIAGTTCSGKTTLSKNIKERFSYACDNITIFPQDLYFKDLKDAPSSQYGYLMDSIDAFHIEEFKRDASNLIDVGATLIPSYDIETNTRISKDKIIYKGAINIFEGLHTIELLDQIDNCIKIYIDTDINRCLERRIARDTLKYDIPEIDIRNYWKHCILPMSEKYIIPQKEKADIVLNN